MVRRVVLAGIVLAFVLPSSAFAASGVPVALSTGAGVAALLAAAGLLLVMLSLRRLAHGSAIAENISFAVLAALCLAASVLVGWLARLFGTQVSPEYARLSADLLGLLAMVFFGIYFFRVRRAMSKFLNRLTGEEQMLTAVLDEDALPVTSPGEE
jgi:nitrate reductase gamma subunit